MPWIIPVYRYLSVMLADNQSTGFVFSSPDFPVNPAENNDSWLVFKESSRSL
jgi:hypothetical protein